VSFGEMRNACAPAMSATLNAMQELLDLWLGYGLSNAVCAAIRDSG
jgi:hypothetical protein